MSTFEENSINSKMLKEKEQTALEILSVSTLFVVEKTGVQLSVFFEKFNFQEKVEQLYKFRDHYFENHSIDDAINRNADTKKELDEVLYKFREFEGVVKN